MSTNPPELIGMCNCGHFEPDYTKHDTCAHCGKPWTSMRMLNALYYLHKIYEDEVKLKKYWRDKAEALPEPARQLCPTHPNVNYKTAWGCPDCVKELREALRGLIAECEYSESSGLPFNFPDGQSQWTQLAKAKALLEGKEKPPAP